MCRLSLAEFGILQEFLQMTKVRYRNRFDSNGGNGNGGAVFMRDGTTINMREVVVNGNLQDNGNVGGILLVRVVNVIVGDSTFTDNTGAR